MFWLCDGEEIILIQYCSVTDGRTDRRSDGQTEGHSFSGYTNACIACYASYALVKTKQKKVMPVVLLPANIWLILIDWLIDGLNTCLQIEAQWAHTLDKTIIPLRLEAGYEPDGWLGPLCRNNLYYDFSAEEKFEDEWSRFQAELKRLQAQTSANIAADTGLYRVSPKLTSLA